MENKRILIVEDEGIQAMNTKLMLLRNGYEVLPIALSGKSAITLAAKHTPDVILMDIRLRGSMDGIEAAATIRNDINAPIIFISAYADEQTHKRIKPITSSAFLEKPVEAEALRAAITSALG